MQINEQDFLSFVTIKQGLADLSVRSCRIRIRVLNRWFVDKELTKQNVEKFFLEFKNKGLKNNSLNSYYFVFHQLKEYCHDRGLPYDFLDGFKAFKKTKPDISVFTLEETNKIINTSLSYGKFEGKDCSFLDFRYKTLTMFLAFTGCRFGEAINLNIKRLDLSTGKAIFINTKNNQNRTVYIFEPLISNLKKLIEGRDLEDYVFRNSHEKKIHPQDYSEDLKRRAKAAEITKRVFPHNFRHTFCTMLLEQGVPIDQVALLVGHKDVRQTYETYSHLADRTL